MDLAGSAGPDIPGYLPNAIITSTPLPPRPFSYGNEPIMRTKGSQKHLYVKHVDGKATPTEEQRRATVEIERIMLQQAQVLSRAEHEAHTQRLINTGTASTSSTVSLSEPVPGISPPTALMPAPNGFPTPQKQRLQPTGTTFKGLLVQQGPGGEKYVQLTAPTSRVKKIGDHHYVTIDEDQLIDVDEGSKESISVQEYLSRLHPFAGLAKTKKSPAKERKARETAVRSSYAVSSQPLPGTNRRLTPTLPQSELLNTPPKPPTPMEMLSPPKSMEQAALPNSIIPMQMNTPPKPLPMFQVPRSPSTIETSPSGIIQPRSRTNSRDMPISVPSLHHSASLPTLRRELASSRLSPLDMLAGGRIGRLPDRGPFQAQPPPSVEIQDPGTEDDDIIAITPPENKYEMTTLHLNGELVDIPVCMLLSEWALRAILTREAFNLISKEKQDKMIEKYLPKLPPGANQTAHISECIAIAFTKKNVCFGNPISAFFDRLKLQWYDPVHWQAAQQLRDHQRVLYDHFLRFYSLNMVRRLIANRHGVIEKTLENHRIMSQKPPGDPKKAKSRKDRLKTEREIRRRAHMKFVDRQSYMKQVKMKEMKLRADRRSQAMLMEISSKTGDIDLSSDEESIPPAPPPPKKAWDRNNSYIRGMVLNEFPDNCNLFGSSAHPPVLPEDPDMALRKFVRRKRDIEEMQNGPPLSMIKHESQSLDKIYDRAGIPSIADKIAKADEELAQVNKEIADLIDSAVAKAREECQPLPPPTPKKNKKKAAENDDPIEEPKKSAPKIKPPKMIAKPRAIPKLPKKRPMKDLYI